MARRQTCPECGKTWTDGIAGCPRCGDGNPLGGINCLTPLAARTFGNAPKEP